MISRTLITNQNVAAHFPFSGRIKPLADNERIEVKKKLMRMQQFLSPGLKTDFISLTETERAGREKIAVRAADFAENMIPKVFPDDPHGDFMQAWNLPLACRTIMLLERHFEDAGKIKLLQAASNYGPMLQFIQMETGASVFGFDGNPEAVNFAAATGRSFVRHGFAQRIPFEDEAFDVVLSRHLLCYNYQRAFFPWANQIEREIIQAELYMEKEIVLPHLMKILGQISRVLKPGGVFISSDEDTVTETAASPFFTEFSRLKATPLSILRK